MGVTAGATSSAGAATEVSAKSEPICPSCAGPARLLYPGSAAAGTRDSYHIARMSYSTPSPIERCTRCRLGWASEQAALGNIHEVYAEGEDDTYTEEAATRRATFRRGVEWAGQWVAEGRLLDIGASAGFLLAEARDLGYEVHGVELSRWAAAEARRRFGLELRVGDLTSAGFAPASFDVITMVDVIEHLIDPFAELRRIADLLRPGGVLYLVTPDLDGLPARLLGRRWWGFEPFHLWYFNRSSLEQALADAGFGVVGARSYRRTFTLGYWLRKGGGLMQQVARLLSRVTRGVGLEHRPVTLDLRDTLEIVCRRVDG